LCALIESLSGISVGEEKRYLIDSRLAKLMAENGCNNYSEFCRLIRAGSKVDLKFKIIDAMTTRETLWFRDVHPYETLLSKVLPEMEQWVKQHNRPAKIWSAACSTGQEPYSIAMTVIEYCERTPQGLNHPFLKGMLKIKATDIANTSITLSKMARYDQVAMSRGLSEARKQKFFIQQGNVATPKPEVKQLVEFEKFNLQDDFFRLGTFNAIFIRNVAIYFAKPFKVQLFERLAKQMEPNGTLIIGATESLLGVTNVFRPDMVNKTVLYRLSKS
jgi:chemotaxis protein methyltransferase CheR